MYKNKGSLLDVDVRCHACHARNFFQTFFICLWPIPGSRTRSVFGNVFLRFPLWLANFPACRRGRSRNARDVHDVPRRVVESKNPKSNSTPLVWVIRGVWKQTWIAPLVATASGTITLTREPGLPPAPTQMARRRGLTKFSQAFSHYAKE